MTPVEDSTYFKRNCVGTVTIPFHARSFRPQVDATCHGKWLNFGYANPTGISRAAPDYTVLTGYVTGATLTWTAGTLRTLGSVAWPGSALMNQTNRALSYFSSVSPQSYAGSWPITGTAGAPASVQIFNNSLANYGSATNQLPIYWSQDIPGAVTAQSAVSTAADHWFDHCEYYATPSSFQQEQMSRNQPVVESRRIIGRHDSAGPVTWLQVDFGANLLVGCYAELWGIP